MFILKKFDDYKTNKTVTKNPEAFTSRKHQRMEELYNWKYRR